MMNKILLWLILSSLLYSQQQVKIPWPSLADSPWPILRGDMQGTGRSEYVGPSTNRVLWRKDMPLGVLYGPVIGYDDVLYMGERALSPDSVNYFYAVDKNGIDLWTFETLGYVPNNGGPIVASDSTIYFFSRNKRLYALLPDGSLKWELENIWANFWPFHPLAKNGDLYVTLSDTLVIISPAGMVKSRITIPDLSPGLVFSTGGDTIFFTTGGLDNRPAALNAADLAGNILWSYNFATKNWGIPLVDNQNKIYVFGTDTITSDNFYLYSINPNGTVNWRYHIPAASNLSSPTMDRDGNVIFHTVLEYDSGWINSIVSLDYFGNLNWVTPLNIGTFEDNYINHGLVSDAEGKIYLGSSFGGNFYCLSNTGEILWTLDLGEYEYDSSPAIGSDGTLYIGTHISSLFQNHKRNLIAIKDAVTSVQNNNSSRLSYSLKQNYPNPFNPITTIVYSIPERSNVTLKIFDILGREVATLINEEKSRGEYSVFFDGSNLSSGIYFYRLQAEEYNFTKKLILLK